MDLLDEIFGEEPVEARGDLRASQALPAPAPKPDPEPEPEPAPEPEQAPQKRRIYSAEEIWQEERDAALDSLSVEQLRTLFRSLPIKVVHGLVQMPPSASVLKPYGGSQGANERASTRAQAAMQSDYDSLGVKGLFNGWAISVVEEAENGDHYCYRRYKAEAPLLLGNSKDASEPVLRETLAKLGH